MSCHCETVTEVSLETESHQPSTKVDATELYNLPGCCDQLCAQGLQIAFLYFCHWHCKQRTTANREEFRKRA